MKDFSQIKWLLDDRLLYSLDGDDPPSNYVSAFVQPGRLCSSPVPEMIAAEIVRRWNAHEDLLAALEEQVAEFDERLREYINGGDDSIAAIAMKRHGDRMDRARAAIAKARGGK